jgi:hypothetical protein
MQCTHDGYFKISVFCDGQQLPSGPNVPATVDTVEEVHKALETVKDFSADLTLGGKLVTFEVVAGCSACGIVPEKKTLKLQNGNVVLDLPSQVVTQ